MARRIDLTGHVYGDWTVLRLAPNRGGRRAWLCRCACGTESEITGNSLRRGNSTRCVKCRDRALSLKKTKGSGVVFEARKELGLTRKEYAEITGLKPGGTIEAERAGRFFRHGGRSGTAAQIKFNRAHPDKRQHRPLFRVMGRKKPQLRSVVLKNCAYCGAVVEQLARKKSAYANAFCDQQHNALFRWHGPKPLDLTATQLTNVERYGPHIRDKSKVKLDVGLMKTVKQAAERKRESPPCPK